MGESKKTILFADTANKNLLSCVQMCERFYSQIENKLKTTNTGDMNGYQTEMQLWQELKSNRNITEPSLLQYLIGFYVKLQQTVLMYMSGNRSVDPYFVRLTENRDRTEQALIYNLYIRLGDLHRYATNPRLSRAYYLKAHQLNPHRGQSYNQLALLCSSEPIKSIYYYCRAYLATEEPSEISRNNIQFAVNKSRYNPIVRMLFNRPILNNSGGNGASGNSNNNNNNNGNGILSPNGGDSLKSTTLVESMNLDIDNWLYVIVIAVYNENVQSIAKPLLDLLIKNTDLKQLQQMDSKYEWSALDVLLDFCLIDKLTTFNFTSFEPDLRDAKSLITQIFELDNFERDDALTTNSQQALKHDYLLLGLKTLKDLHAKLKFVDYEEPEANLSILLNRILSKLDKVLQLISEKKSQTNRHNMKKRNIALQSILGSRY